MLVDGGLVGGDVDAVDLVSGDEALDPLELGADGAVRRGRDMPAPSAIWSKIFISGWLGLDQMHAAAPVSRGLRARGKPMTSVRARGGWLRQCQGWGTVLRMVASSGERGWSACLRSSETCHISVGLRMWV